MHGVKDHLTESILLLILCCSLVQTVTIRFTDITTATITEGETLTREVCHDSAVPTLITISFSLSASPGNTGLILPPGMFTPTFGRACVSFTITSVDNNMREDTKAFQISLLPMNADVDESWDDFILYVQDNEVISEDTSSCPAPTVINSLQVSCQIVLGSIACSYDCNHGFESLSGDDSRICTNSFRWSGSPLFCIPIVDECSLGIHNCFSTASCANAMGSFTCTCPFGYFGDGVTCTENAAPNPPNCPVRSLYVTATQGSLTTVVVYGPFMCEDSDERNPLTATCVPTSGTPFNIGRSTVTCTCTDLFGEESRCTFDVIVAGNQAPGPPNCPENTLDIPAAAGSATAAAHYGQVTCEDPGNPTPLTATCNPVSGSQLAVGQYQVTCTCTDIFGASSECTFQLRVAVNTAPSNPVCPSVLTVPATQGSTTPEAIYGPFSCLDADEVSIPATCNPPSGTQLSIGQYSVTCSCIDRFGAVGQCTFTVTVNDVDECSTSNGHSCDTSRSDCQNTQGDYYCQCKPGFIGADYTPPSPATCQQLPVLNAAPFDEDVSNTSITISWRAWDPAMDVGDPLIVAYIPYYRRNASDEWISGPRILSNETLQFKADNLEVDTLYEFSVAVVREGKNGEGRRSPSVTVKTYCNVPNVAASVNIQLTSSNAVNVSWQIPTSKMMCSTGVTRYKVYYRIEGSTDDTPLFAGTVEDVDTRWFIVDEDLLEPGSSYIFFVTVTTDQESGFSESELFEVPTGGLPVGIIVAVISIVFLLIILLLVVLLLIKRKRDKEAGNNTPVPKPVDNTYDNPVFGIPDVHSRQDAEPAKAAEPVPQMQPSVREDYENKSVENLSIEKESSPDDVIYGNLEQPKPIRVAEFGEYFRQNVDKFDHEFSILEGSKKQFDWTAAEDPANKKKNRFKSMYTYDHSRVVLQDLPDQEGSDYYNASFIKDTNDVVAYIASQAPNRASLEDFVRMIWEQHVTTIVMVANLYEDGKERCLQYWPENEGGSTSFGFVTVTWLKTTQFSDFVIRYFTFKRGKETREVQHLHFLTWPDKDTPEHGTALIEFTKQSKLLHRGKKYPMLVHCSAGIGRTGTFICLNCMMDVLRDEEYIDVFGFVNKIRQNRINMVQTSKQYVFLYKCLNEYHLTHQTEMSVSQMTRLNVESHRGILLGEFELLSELGHSHRKDTVKNCVGKKKENIARNRVRNMVPSNRNRVFLMSPGQSNEKDYINASYVKSFQKKDAFITTQSPLPSTIEDFWRMVYDLKSPLIVMLNQLDPTDKTCVQYWPDRGSSEYGNMYVTCVATERQSDYTQRTFEVKHVNLKDVLSVIHLQMEEWRPDINLQSIVGLIKDIDMMQKRGQYSQPIVIHCINGFERSGVVVTVKSELERIAVTERIDVFSTVKKLRDQHEHMLKNKDDYILCYHLLKAYVAISNRNYENSEDLRRGGGMKSK